MDEIGRELDKDGMYKVRVTGHSLGGALAAAVGLYASCDERFLRVSAVKVFTFGAPRLGDRSVLDAVRYLEQQNKLRIARFVNQFDIIPQIPTWTWNLDFTRYHHVGLQIRLQPSDVIDRMKADKDPLDIQYTRDEGFWSDLKRRFRESLVWHWSVKESVVEAHGLTNYQDRVLPAHQHLFPLQSDCKRKTLECHYQEAMTAGSDQTGWYPTVPLDRAILNLLVMIAYCCFIKLCSSDTAHAFMGHIGLVDYDVSSLVWYLVVGYLAAAGFGYL